MEKQLEVFIGLGSNLGNKKQNLLDAISYIHSKQENEVIETSNFIESEPWGFKSENSFINCCLNITTTLAAIDLLSFLKEIEENIGRTEKSVNAVYSDRLIDIDILFYSDEIIKTKDLIVPHPQLGNREFVLKPLVEIAPYFVHPISKMTLSQLLVNLR